MDKPEDLKKGFAATLPSRGYRIAFSSRNAKGVESTVRALLERAREKNVKIRGPVRLPTRSLRITTRKSPCGNGTNTWDTYEMKIYKRYLDLIANQETVQGITAIAFEPGVDVEVTTL